MSSSVRVLILFTFLAIFTTACAKVEEQLKPAKLEKIESNVQVKKIWSASVGAGRSKYQPVLNVGVMDGVIYTADRKGKLKALDVAKGKALWQQRLKKTELSAGVGVTASALFVGTINGELIALDRETGEERWRAQLSSEIISTPQGNDDVVIAQAIDGRVFAYDIEDGKRLWSYDHPTPILTYRAQATPLVTDTQVFIAFDNGQLLCFEVDDGLLAWSARVSQPQGVTELERAVDLDTQPLLVGPYVFVAGARGRIVSLNRTTGRIVWSESLSTFNNLLNIEDTIVAIDEDSHISAFNANTGVELWKSDKLHRRNLGSPGALSQYVATVDDKGYLHLLDLNSGDIVARKKPIGSGFSAPLAYYEDSLLVLSDSGTLSVYQVATQKP